MASYGSNFNGTLESEDMTHNSPTMLERVWTHNMSFNPISLYSSTTLISDPIRMMDI